MNKCHLFPHLAAVATAVALLFDATPMPGQSRPKTKKTAAASTEYAVVSAGGQYWVMPSSSWKDLRICLAEHGVGGLKTQMQSRLEK